MNDPGCLREKGVCCREKTEDTEVAAQSCWPCGCVHSSAGQFKPLHKDTWLRGSGSTLPIIKTARSQGHNLYFLPFSAGHSSLAACKRNLSWTSLSKGEVWAQVTQQRKVKRSVYDMSGTLIFSKEVMPFYTSINKSEFQLLHSLANTWCYVVHLRYTSGIKWCLLGFKFSFL